MEREIGVKYLRADALRNERSLQGAQKPSRETDPERTGVGPGPHRARFVPPSGLPGGHVRRPPRAQCCFCHPGAGRGPENPHETWIPACAGMTVDAQFNGIAPRARNTGSRPASRAASPPGGPSNRSCKPARPARSPSSPSRTPGPSPVGVDEPGEGRFEIPATPKPAVRPVGADGMRAMPTRCPLRATAGPSGEAGRAGSEGGPLKDQGGRSRRRPPPPFQAIDGGCHPLRGRGNVPPAGKAPRPPVHRRRRPATDPSRPPGRSGRVRKRHRDRVSFSVGPARAGRCRAVF